MRKIILCPKCKAMAKVTDAVMNPDDNEMYRQRKCIECGYSFYTIEYEVNVDSNFLDSWYKYHRQRKRNGKHAH